MAWTSAKAKLRTFLNYTKICCGVHYSLTAASITGLYVAIKSDVDVVSGMENLFKGLHIPRVTADGTPLESPSGGGDMSNLRRNRTADMASVVGSLPLAFYLNKVLFPVRTPITALVAPVVLSICARRRGIINTGGLLGKAAAWRSSVKAELSELPYYLGLYCWVYTSISAVTITGLYVAVKANFDVEPALEKVYRGFKVPAPLPPQSEVECSGAMMGDVELAQNKRNRTAELAASSGGALALACSLSKTLCPVKSMIASILAPKVAGFMTRLRNHNSVYTKHLLSAGHRKADNKTDQQGCNKLLQLTDRSKTNTDYKR